MRDDYLWDGSGEIDPEVQRLELLLGTLRHKGSAPEVPAKAGWFPRLSLSVFFPLRAAAAAMVLLAAGIWVVTRGPYAGWEVTSLAGQRLGRLDVGEVFQTDASSRARLNMDDVGEMEVQPNTRLRLMKARVTEHRVALELGKIQARIWAPARRFFVETPSALAVDLGCIYTLEVDPTGGSLLRTQVGWVGFEWKGRESFVPSGAACATRPGVGPGTPYFEDASETFCNALRRFDFEGGGDAALGVVLAQSRREDALTLWHLLPRTTGAERAKVYDRLAALVPAPEGV